MAIQIQSRAAISRLGNSWRFGSEAFGEGEEWREEELQRDIISEALKGPYFLGELTSVDERSIVVQIFLQTCRLFSSL